MLVAERISKNFGATAAVADASFEIERGSFTGVIGRSGAGKSTLLRVINRLIDPSAGRILCDGTDITTLRGVELRRWRARAAMIFQQFNLVGRLERKGMAKAADFRIIFKSDLIVNSPMAYLSALPPDLKAAIKKAVLELHAKDPAAFDKIYEGKQLPFVEVDHKAYEPVVEIIKFVDELRKKKRSS